MKITAQTSLKELAFIVSTALEKAGYTAVLCGGAVVSIYTENQYESGDLDFITPHSHQDLAPILAKLGFRPSGRSFIHPECPYYVEFPASPVMLGSEPSAGPDILKAKAKTLRLLSPTESVMDRLIAFFAWRDPQALEQALMICKKQAVDLKRVKKWAMKEGYTAEFEIFHKELRVNDET